MVKGHGIRFRAMIGKLVDRGAELELEEQRGHQKNEATIGALIMLARASDGEGSERG